MCFQKRPYDFKINYNGTKKMLLLRAWYFFVRFNYTLKTDLV